MKMSPEDQQKLEVGNYLFLFTWFFGKGASVLAYIPPEQLVASLSGRYELAFWLIPTAVSATILNYNYRKGKHQ